MASSGPKPAMSTVIFMRSGETCLFFWIDMLPCAIRSLILGSGPRLRAFENQNGVHRRKAGSLGQRLTAPGLLLADLQISQLGNSRSSASASRVARGITTAPPGMVGDHLFQQSCALASAASQKDSIGIRELLQNGERITFQNRSRLPQAPGMA